MDRQQTQEGRIALFGSSNTFGTPNLPEEMKKTAKGSPQFGWYVECWAFGQSKFLKLRSVPEWGVWNSVFFRTPCMLESLCRDCAATSFTREYTRGNTFNGGEESTICQMSCTDGGCPVRMGKL
jgi:hypothetical protein